MYCNDTNVTFMVIRSWTTAILFSTGPLEILNSATIGCSVFSKVLILSTHILH